MLSIPDLSESQSAKGGTLYVVATPIGNLYDITLRALGILKSVDVVAAEDTRHTAHLLSYFGIKSPLVSCHEFNEEGRSIDLIKRLQNGESVALVSDAGTPAVSDPGFKLVSRVIGEGIQVIPIPGVSAAITALCASGLSTDSFVFIGFLSRKKKRQKEQLEALKKERRTIIFYESPRRVVDLLQEIKGCFGNRNAVVARELTKIHEEFIRGSVSDIIGKLNERNQIKGECTVILAGATDEKPDMEMILEEIEIRLSSGSISPSHLSKELAEKYGLSRRIIYEEILRKRQRHNE